MLRNSLEASLVGLEPVQGMYCHVTDGVCDVKSQLLSRVQLFVTSVDCSPPGSSVHGILQARRLEWTAISSSREPSETRESTSVSYISCTGRQALCH